VFFKCLRIDDQCRITWESVEFRDDGVYVQLHYRETGVVDDELKLHLPCNYADCKVRPVEILKQKKHLYGFEQGRVLRAVRNCAFIAQQHDKNTLTKIPQFIAKDLHLPAP